MYASIFRSLFLALSIVLVAESLLARPSQEPGYANNNDLERRVGEAQAQEDRTSGADSREFQAEINKTWANLRARVDASNAVALTRSLLEATLPRRSRLLEMVRGRSDAKDFNLGYLSLASLFAEINDQIVEESERSHKAGPRFDREWLEKQMQEQVIEAALLAQLIRAWPGMTSPLVIERVITVHTTPEGTTRTVQDYRSLKKRLQTNQERFAPLSEAELKRQAAVFAKATAEATAFYKQVMAD